MYNFKEYSNIYHGDEQTYKALFNFNVDINDALSSDKDKSATAWNCIRDIMVDCPKLYKRFRRPEHLKAWYSATSCEESKREIELLLWELKNNME